MTLRRLNIVLTTIAIGLAAYAFYIRPDPDFSTCMGWNKAAETLESCTALMDSPDLKAEDLPVFLTKRAWASRRLGDFEAAMADINRALELQPSTPLIWVYRAFINDAEDNWAAADQDFEQAILLAPENLSTLMDRAKTLTGRGDDNGALRDYMLALEIDPNSQRAMRGIVSSYRSMQQYEMALEWLNKAMQQWPEDASYARVLGEMQYLYSEDYQAALGSFETAAMLDSEHELNLIFMGAANLKLGRIDLGKSYIERHAEQMARKGKDGSLYWRAIALLANLTQLAGNPEFYFRGTGYAHIGQPELSRVAFQRYLDSGGSHAMRIMQTLLADYYECAGAACEGRSDARYEAALSRYLDATGNAFLLDYY